MKKIWPFSFYFLYFGAFASLAPFFVIFYQGLGFTGTQIGLLTGVAPLITLVATPFGHRAGRCKPTAETDHGAGAVHGNYFWGGAAHA
ncbi:MAG: MFS transporter [Anaerolineales bacterium]|uniref:MFS transporter n=1 Tax=Candidatus Villigracilis proximus TaxID=3140683 RepID=UPI003135672C|nr:MFS transporter [Anaerolineales bacterium]